MGKGWGFLLQKNFKGELKDFTWMYSRHVKPQPYLKNPNTHQGNPGVAWDMRQFSQIKQDISHYARWQDQVTRSAGSHCCFSSYRSTLKMRIIPESMRNKNSSYYLLRPNYVAATALGVLNLSTQSIL